MNLEIELANKHSIVSQSSCMRTSSDIPVVRLEELQRWLEAWDGKTEENGLHACIDTLLDQLADLQQHLQQVRDR